MRRLRLKQKRLRQFPRKRPKRHLRKRLRQLRRLRLKQKRLRQLRRHRLSNQSLIAEVCFYSDITKKVVKKIVRGQSVDNRLPFLYTITVLNELIHL